MEIALNLSFTIELSSGEFNYAEVRNHGGKVLGYSDNRECVNYACLAITRAAAAIGESKWKDRYTLWEEKTGLVAPEDISGVDAVYWGTVLESIVAQEYARRANVQVRLVPRIIRHPKYPFMGAHLDRIRAKLLADQQPQILPLIGRSQGIPIGQSLGTTPAFHFAHTRVHHALQQGQGTTQRTG